MPEDPATVLGVGFDGRVSTAAGGAEPGEADGTGPEVTDQAIEPPFRAFSTPTLAMYRVPERTVEMRCS